MKILDSEFRKELYGNLVEAGYAKDEAKVIVGNKYFSALKEKTANQLSQIREKVDANQFQESIDDLTQINEDIQELLKLTQYIEVK